MTEKTSTKISDKGRAFLKRLANNRIKAGTDQESLAYWELIEAMEKYFKLNNPSYLELVHTEFT